MFGADKAEQRGIIPRSIETIVNYADTTEKAYQTAPIETSISSVEIICSFFQIYNERVQDLLQPEAQDLQVRESAKMGVYVENLRELPCKTINEVLEVLAYGESNRTVSETAMNSVSSRSHSVFCIKLIQKFPDQTVKSISRLFMADLAGSERVSRSKVTGAGFEEATAINGSLSALGNCINALTERGRSHIPFRDSKLTFILKDSLGGNAKTTLVVALSPHISNQEETSGTLKFAERCKKVQNKAKVNVTRSNKELEKLLEQLQSEVARLQAKNKLLEDAIKACGGKMPSEAQIAAAMGGSAAEVVEEAGMSAAAALQLENMKAEFNLQADELREALTQLSNMKAQHAEHLDQVSEEQAEAKALAAATQAENAKLAQQVQSVEHKLKAQAAERKEVTRELIVHSKRLKAMEAEKKQLLATLAQKEEMGLSLTKVAEDSKRQCEQIRLERDRALDEVKSLQDLVGKGGRPGGTMTLVEAEMRIAQIEADLKQKDTALSHKADETARLDKKCSTLTAENRTLAATKREGQAEVDKWRAEADEALAKQAHLSVKVSEQGVRIEALEKEAGDQAMQKSMFETSWRTEIMDREVQESEVKRLRAEVVQLKAALEFEERRRRWGRFSGKKDGEEEDEGLGLLEPGGADVEEVQGQSETWYEPDATTGIEVMIIMEVQTYSNWSGEWASVEQERDPAWLGKQLGQKPKTGKRWDSEWVVSTDHANTDADGWGYCSSVSSVKDRYHKHSTRPAKKVHHFARCRTWVRRCMDA